MLEALENKFANTYCRNKFLLAKIRYLDTGRMMQLISLINLFKERDKQDWGLMEFNKSRNMLG
jgi:hypothetical protein